MRNGNHVVAAACSLNTSWYACCTFLTLLTLPWKIFILLQMPSRCQCSPTKGHTYMQHRAGVCAKRQSIWKKCHGKMFCRKVAIIVTCHNVLREAVDCVVCQIGGNCDTPFWYARPECQLFGDENCTKLTAEVVSKWERWLSVYIIGLFYDNWWRSALVRCNQANKLHNAMSESRIQLCLVIGIYCFMNFWKVFGY